MELESAFATFQKELEREKIKWVALNNLHITLAFMGDTDEKIIPALSEELRKITSAINRFSFCLKGAGVFQNLRNPRVLWIGTENTDLLKNLYDGIYSVIGKYGFKPEHKAFSPHLTLGRIKIISNTDRLKKLLQEYENRSFQDVPVNEIIFYESILRPEGPVYKVIDTFVLL